MSSTHPAAAGLDYFDEIATHSAALAEAAEHNLDAPVEHCPGWSVTDLVAHVRQVHWFWGTIAELRLAAPPDGERPSPLTGADLIAQLRTGALSMVETLRAADQQTPVWTWAPAQQNIGFISRHQVQEAAVHRWDAEHAAGRSYHFDVPVAVDSIEEFLTFSVASPADPPPESTANLDGAFVLSATDADASWTISDAHLPGTAQFERGAVAGLPTISATASDLLLWLYRRVELEVTASDQPAASELIQRFQTLGDTD
ncbi:MAG: maleylpyruvate isomerase family mycothiol-dependent enzyme [Actinomycetota bacterium]|nr:maleylpyruvate isomerase family mycothiol-dependent enzyme [Actinomycetota bacterium]MDQ2958562.1 maleylpyruvate isomerase family mycothiol-dependent enzyme [Actinomycetota bacterium]